MVLGAMPSVAAHAEVFPGKDGIENETAEYHALAPKTVVAMQQFRETHTTKIRSSQGREGSLSLTNLNPSVNSWYLLQVSRSGGAQGTTYHLENPDPSSRRLMLDEAFPSSLIIVEGNSQYPCGLNLTSAQNSLDQARASQTTFAPLCGGKVMLRNPAKWHRTSLEAVTDFLRDEVWGGEKVIVSVRNNGRPWILRVPVLTPRLSSYWLGLVTAVPANIARALIGGLKHDIPADDAALRRLVPQRLLTFRHESVVAALEAERNHAVAGRWTEGAFMFRAWGGPGPCGTPRP